MKTFKVKLNTIEKVKAFVNTTMLFPCMVDLCSDHYVIDAKSIMGIFSLDLMNPLELRIHADDCDNLIEKLQPFMV